MLNNSKHSVAEDTYSTVIVANPRDPKQLAHAAVVEVNLPLLRASEM